MHTKERWAVVDCDEFAEVVAGNNELIATVHRGGDMSYLADATRIAACHNACLTMAEPEEDVKAAIAALSDGIKHLRLLSSPDDPLAKCTLAIMTNALARVQGGK